VAGFSLVEVLVVISIIAILVALIIRVAARFESQNSERLLKSTFSLLDAALGQFKDFGYSYVANDYEGLEFQLDCNGFPTNLLQQEFEKALGLAAGSVLIIGDHNDPNFSGSEAMYFFLCRVPQSKQTLAKIDPKMVTDKGADNKPIQVQIVAGNTMTYPLTRVIDPWGRTLRYSYYKNALEISSDEPVWDPDKETRNFPVLTSAGPDGIFGTADDVSSR
jgi:prepilin-type N-terminal cleavage/methylation domain-containing protein